MPTTPFLAPFSEAFFLRNRSLEASVQDHLDCLLRTRLGSVAGQPLYGLNIIEAQVAVGGDNSRFCRLVEAAILYGEPRVRAAKVEVTSSYPTELHLRFTLDLDPVAGKDSVQMKAVASLDPFRLKF